MRTMRAVALLVAAMAILSIGAASAQVDDGAPVVVIEVGDPIDQRVIDFVIGTLANEDAHAFVLRIDSPGVSSGDLDALLAAVADADAPVVSWIGPAPAVAYGGAASLANRADIRYGAPGAVVGFLDPAVQRGGAPPPPLRTDGVPVGEVEVTAEALQDATAVVGEGGAEVIPGFVDATAPALGQLIVSLDGVTVQRGDRMFVLDTAATTDAGDTEAIVQARTVAFVEPGLLDRFLRLASRPETAFLFLVFGIAFGVFEYYAAGSGLMAFVAGLSLILAGYGLATLPIWWPAVGLVLLGAGILVWGFLLNRVDWRAALGSVLVLAGGITFTTSRPAYPPAIWMVVVATAAAATFIWYSLTTVVRGRFATPTVGREDLIGRRCLVVETLDPIGVVVVDGARWRASADRGVILGPGAAVEIVGVTGLLLDVDPVGAPPPQGAVGHDDGPA